MDGDLCQADEGDPCEADGDDLCEEPVSKCHSFLPHFSKASHAPKMFFFLAASLLKVKMLYPPSVKLVVRPEADGSDPLHGQ